MERSVLNSSDFVVFKVSKNANKIFTEHHQNMEFSSQTHGARIGWRRDKGKSTPVPPIISMNSTGLVESQINHSMLPRS